MIQNESILVWFCRWVRLCDPGSGDLWFHKFSFFIVLVLVSAIAAQTSTPASTKKCEVCSTEFVPICAAPAGSKEDKQKMSFSNICAMRKFNCEKNKSAFISKNFPIWNGI